MEAFKKIEDLKNKIIFYLQMLIDGAIDIHEYISDEVIDRPCLIEKKYELLYVR